MKTCPNCGNQLTDDALFCNNCGTNVTNVAANAASDASKVAGETISAAAGAANAGNAQNFQQGAPVNNQPQNYAPQPQYRQYDPTDHTAEFDPRDIADNKLFAVLPYFTLLGIIVALLVKESAFTKFHCKNAIRIEIASILACIPAIIPFIGWLVTGVLLIIIFVVSIIAIVNCFQGKAKEVPIISSIGFLK